MDKLGKALRKMSDEERACVKIILQKILRRDTRGLDVKKLKGRDDIFRVRSGNWRIIYRFGGKQALILAIERRNEKTYK